MIDIHTHICFGVDDGAENLAESLEMLSVACRNGTDGVVLTPHSNTPYNFANLWSADLLDRFNKIRAAVSLNEIPVRVYSGQEILCHGNVLQLLEKGMLITLNNSDYPLVEFDFEVDSEECFWYLSEILKMGYIPIVAHPERYSFIQETPALIEKIKKMGCVIQLDKSSVIGEFGRSSKITSDFILFDNLADVIASDCHSPESRTPNMSKCYNYVAGTYSHDYAELLFETNPALLLNNKRI